MKYILLSRFSLHVNVAGKHSSRRVQCCDTDFEVNFFLLSYVIINLYWGMRSYSHFVNALNLLHICFDFPTFKLQQLLLLVILFHKLYFINFRSKHWCWHLPYKFQDFWDVKPYLSLLISSVSSSESRAELCCHFLKLKMAPFRYSKTSVNLPVGSA